MTLLNNLKVQERQNRVCTTVAIAIVAETCSPFTVLPALMNEYKVGLPRRLLSRCGRCFLDLLSVWWSSFRPHEIMFMQAMCGINWCW